MPATTEKQRKLFALALSVKRGKTSKNSVSKEVLNIANKTSEEELSKMASSVQTEATTSASSGAYEAPFGLSKKDMNTLENMKENLTLEHIEKLVKNILIKEEVYGVSPKEFKSTTPKVETTKSNYKTTFKNNSTSGKNSTKSGETSSKSTKNSMKAVEESIKNNLKNATVENKNRMQSEDERIEAHQNGLEDLEYDSITPEKKKKNKEYLLNDKFMGQGNQQKTNVNQQIIDDAKKRNDSRNNSKFNKITAFGSDVEFNPKQTNTNKKELAYENFKPMKTLNFKKPFDNQKDVIKRANKLSATYKENNMVFEMYDGNNRFTIRWEGNIPVIIGHLNEKQAKEGMLMFERFGKYNPTDAGIKTSKLNETDILKEMVSKRNYLKEDYMDEQDDFIPQGIYTVSNSGGYEVMIHPSGDAAKVREAFGGNNPKTSDWLEIEYVQDEDSLDSHAVIDPNGYNIPLDQVMRINR